MFLHKSSNFQQYSITILIGFDRKIQIPCFEWNTSISYEGGPIST